MFHVVNHLFIDFPWVFHKKQPENPSQRPWFFGNRPPLGEAHVVTWRGRLGRCSGSQPFCPGAKIWPIGTRTVYKQPGKETVRKRQDIYQKNADISMIMCLCVCMSNMIYDFVHTLCHMYHICIHYVRHV